MPGGRGAHAQQLAAGGLHAALAGHALREGDHLFAHARLVQDARLRRRPRSAPAPCPTRLAGALRCHGGGAYKKRGARAGRATGGPFRRPARRSNPWDQQQNLASPQQQHSDGRCSGTSTTTAAVAERLHAMHVAAPGAAAVTAVGRARGCGNDPVRLYGIVKHRCSGQPSASATWMCA